MKEIRKIDKYLLKITTVETAKRIENKIDELYNCNKELARENGKTAVVIKEKDQMIQVKEKEIKRLEERIQDKEAVILDLASKVDMAKMDIQELSKSIDKKVANAKGGFTKEINKLKAELTTKEQLIKHYEEAVSTAEAKVKELQERNSKQAETISKLSSEKKHIIEETMNDGLPKQTKKALSKVIEKKNEEKGEMLKNVENELEATVAKLDATKISVGTPADSLSKTAQQKNNKKNIKKKKRNKR